MRIYSCVSSLFTVELRPLINELSKIDQEINIAISRSDSLIVADLESQFINMRKKLTDYEFEFINQNNDSYISSLILRRMIFERSIDFRLADSLLNNFSESIKKTNSSFEIKKIIDDYNQLTRSKSAIGALVIDSISLYNNFCESSKNVFTNDWLGSLSKGPESFCVHIK